MRKNLVPEKKHKLILFLCEIRCILCFQMKLFLTFSFLRLLTKAQRNLLNAATQKKRRKKASSLLSSLKKENHFPMGTNKSLHVLCIKINKLYVCLDVVIKLLKGHLISRPISRYCIDWNSMSLFYISQCKLNVWAPFEIDFFFRHFG